MVELLLKHKADVEAKDYQGPGPRQERKAVRSPGRRAPGVEVSPPCILQREKATFTSWSSC